ncbi:MAG: membrane protein insertase YidC [Gammaproteobacteria bacterium CG22_combo_CG10-13_8_21_14_all_40_8]|nr:MAG: membrane protein insertase YidC [Gammaproteobacteria bacterium CG22_combo_CG10-13_8_21_14_all_40_8]
MERQRTLLIGLFAILSYFLFLTWQQDHAPKTNNNITTTDNSEIDVGLPQASTEVELNESTPNIDTSVPMEPDDAQPIQNDNISLIEVQTDLLQLTINPVGGNIVGASLNNYTMGIHSKEVVSLFTRNDQRVYFAESGLIGKTTPDGSSQKALFRSDKANYTLGNSDLILDIPLYYTNQDGVRFIKTYRLRKGSYLIELDYQVINNSDQPLKTRLYTQLLRDQLPDTAKSAGLGMNAYLGGAYSTQETKYTKYAFSDIVDDIVDDSKPLHVKTQGGWVAIIQHYFLTSWIPAKDKMNTLYTLKTGENLAIGAFQPAVAILPGTQHHLKAELYVGPKNQEKLKKIAPGLELTVDYGVLWWIGQPIFALLKMLHSLLGNWGAAIIMVTFTVKLLLFPLSNAQYRSFAKMRKLQPKMQALKERYGDDRQKMGKATMELYKKEKVNPLGGCLPLVIQMPVFFALYWVLMESIELRQAPFMLWIHDLSIQDPYYILPLIMGASMYLMQKMQPTAPNMDPMQQKIMQFMPVMMTVFFLFFPAGLVLYWVVNNTLSIVQQLAVNKMIEKEDLKIAAKAKG